MTHPYATDIYAGSLRRDGRTVGVPEWGCSVLVRPIAGGLEDAAGTYPLTILAEDADIEGGLHRLRTLGLVSVVLVIDDFHRPELEHLERDFDFVRPFKVHFLNQPAHGPRVYDKHHRYEIRRAGRSVEVGVMDLSRHLNEWVELYAVLSDRHGLSGMHDLPREHHSTLASLPGVTAIGAWAGPELAACHVWVHDNGRVHSHLAASSERGYSCGAAYAVYDASIRHFAGAELINFGGAAGNADIQDDGLARFKRGFANATARSYLCGKVLDPDRYHELVERSVAPRDTLYFPAYRAT
jgi:hypothetical protein